MKKTSGIAAAVLIIAAAYSGSSWYLGKQAQTVIQDAVENANQRLTAIFGNQAGEIQASVRIDHYDRGIFTSLADYTLELRDKNGQSLDIRLEDTLDHGPFPWSQLRQGSLVPLIAYSQARMIESPSTRAWVQSQKDGQSPLTIQTRVDFGGAGRSEWLFHPATITRADGVVSFSGGSIVMQLGNHLNDAMVKGQFAGLAVSGREPGQNLQVSGVSIDAQSTSATAGKVSTRSQVNIARFVTDDPDVDGDIVVADTRMGFTSEQSGDLVDADARYDFGAIDVGTIKLGSVSLGAGIERVDLAALSALANEYDAMLARHQEPDLASLNADEQKQLNQRLLAVLATGPRLRIDPLLWKNDKGQSVASLHVSLQKPDAVHDDSLDALLMQAIGQTELNITLSRAMIVQAAGQMQSNPDDARDVQEFVGTLFDDYMAGLQETGLVTVDGDQARVAITYADQNVQVNGQSMPVDQFMQRIFGLLLML